MTRPPTTTSFNNARPPLRLPKRLGTASLTILLSGCGSIRTFHQIGSTSDKPAKIPGATAARMAVESTVLATARAPWAATKVGARVLVERTSTLITGNGPVTRMKMTRGQGALPPAGGEAFEALLDREGLPPRSSGSVRFFVDGSSFYPEFHRALNGARRQIDMQAYIFDNDPFGVDMAERLKRKSKEIHVRVYFDTLGTLLAVKVEPPLPPPPGFQPPGNLKKFLTEDSRIDVRTTRNPYFTADHTKLHVIDGNIAFVGGMNVGVEYRHTWHDLMAKVEGPVVHELASVYHDHWRGEDWKYNWGFGWLRKKPAPRGEAAPLPVSGRQVPLRMLLTDTALGKREILRAALAGIRCAKKRIWIETPYFSCDEVSVELQKAVKRGVDVRVIVPSANDSKLMKKANVEELKKLLETGARVYEYPGMTHLKATVCDDWGMFGSANYDTLSMRINRELNLAISDAATVQDMANKVFLTDFGKSTRLTLEMCKARGGMFAEVLGDQL